MSDDVIEQAARVMAMVGDYDGYFERLDAWAAATDEERETGELEEPLSYDQGDAEFWLSRAQALADAGLLPTEVEWGVKYPRRDNDLHRGPWSKEEAESWIQEGIDDGVLPGAFILASRRTTPWKETR